MNAFLAHLANLAAAWLVVARPTGVTPTAPHSTWAPAPAATKE